MISKDIKYVIAYLGLPTLVFAVAAQFLFFSRAIFILDYVLLCLISSYISRRYLILLWVSTFVLDWVFSTAPTFHFQRTDFFRNIYAIAFMSWPIVLLASALMSLAAVGIFAIPSPFLSKVSTISRRSKCVVVSLALVLWVSDIVNGTNGLVEGAWPIVDVNIAGAHLPQLISATRAMVTSTSDVVLRDSFQPAASATSDLLSTLGGVKKPNYDKILLVVVESFGAPFSSKLGQRYLESFNRPLLRERYEIRQSEVSFAGSTVPGEIRELCGLRIAGTGDAVNINVDNCLPHVLKTMGYQTTALHGYSSYMFDRNIWYPRLGFDTTYFGEDIDSAGYKERCGSVFRGNCDSDVAKLIQLLLSGGEKSKRFIYWLTLNSHLPVARDTSLARDLDCSELLTIDDHEKHEEACRLSSLLLGLLDSIADIAEQTEDSLKVIIVGDHAPPFVLRKDRQVFKSDVVPFIVLSSKARAVDDAKK